MSLCETLAKPLVVEPVEYHTHTVVFLHLFKQGATEDESRSKILSGKMTKDHRTLLQQFPTVRWVFPYPKHQSDLHWSNLSIEEKKNLGLTMPGVPYITQIILQEAERAGGLDKIILGGQGITAEAAHDAMSSFPEPDKRTPSSSSELAESEMEEEEQNMTVTTTHHIRKHFHPSWTQVTQLQMAGFVGMHEPDGPHAHVTRDVRDFGIRSKMTGLFGVNHYIVVNTPHQFIKGGYTPRTATWDGPRIDKFAQFLEDLGVQRTKMDTRKGSKETLTPTDRSTMENKKRNLRGGLQDGMDEKQRYAQEILKQKAEDDKQREQILRRIEAQHVERKIRQNRERQARFYRDNPREGQPAQTSQMVLRPARTLNST